MKEEIYIHYGHKHFDKNLFVEIKNENFVKPYGGLWASNIESAYGWKEWTENENFRTNKYSEDNYFKFRLSKEAKILKLKDISDLEKLPKNKGIQSKTLYVCLDFEELKKSYDAIEVYIEKLYWLLYGWDCDSILILNKDIVEEMEE